MMANMKLCVVWSRRKVPKKDKEPKKLNIVKEKMFKPFTHNDKNRTNISTGEMALATELMEAKERTKASHYSTKLQQPQSGTHMPENIN